MGLVAQVAIGIALYTAIPLVFHILLTNGWVAAKATWSSKTAQTEVSLTVPTLVIGFVLAASFLDWDSDRFKGEFEVAFALTLFPLAAVVSVLYAINLWRADKLSAVANFNETQVTFEHSTKDDDFSSISGAAPYVDIGFLVTNCSGADITLTKIGGYLEFLGERIQDNWDLILPRGDNGHIRAYSSRRLKLGFRMSPDFLASVAAYGKSNDPMPWRFGRIRILASTETVGPWKRQVEVIMPKRLLIEIPDRITGYGPKGANFSEQWLNNDQSLRFGGGYHG